MTPAFSSSKLKEMFHIAENCTNKLMIKLKHFEENADGVISPRTVIGRYTMDVICCAAFSANFNVQEGEEEPESVKLLKSSISSEVFQDPVVFFLSIFPSFEWIFEKMDYSVY